MISKFTIQKINEEARVEDVVGEFVTLKKRGANLMGLCPFHNEKTPSFTVSPAKNIYKCFGCGKAGGPISFLTDSQQMTYPDALRFLAKKYNIEIEEENISEEAKQQEVEKHNLVESIHIANAAAQKFFSDYMLHNESGKIGLAYFKERGFLNHTIEKFQLGFAPDGYDVFTKHALKEGFQLEVLKKAGLTSPKENSTIDFFRNRVVFPIHNMTGKVVGFGGRIMVKDEKAPKYVNTPESEVYLKSKILYGAYFAKNEIRKKDECLLVEGYMDVISLHQAGIENAVSSSGTSLTTEQIHLISKITKNVTVIYDGDDAGISASIKSISPLLAQELNASIIFLPDKEDPDSYVKKYGAEALNDFIKTNKKELFQFILDYSLQNSEKDLMNKLLISDRLSEILIDVADANKRAAYIRLMSQRLDIDEQRLITNVNKKLGFERKKKKTESENSRESQVEDKNEEQDVSALNDNKHYKEFYEITQPHLERDVVRILIEFGSWKIGENENETTVAQYVLEELDGLDIESSAYKPLYELIKHEFAQGKVHPEKFFTANNDEQITNATIQILAQPYTISENWYNKYKIVVPEKRDVFIKDIASGIMRFKQFKNISELKKIEQRIKDSKDETELLKLMKLHKLLIEQKKEFARTVGNVIYRPTM